MGWAGNRRRGGGPRKPRTPLSKEEMARTIQEARKLNSPGFNYRQRSLEIHGLICAKCAREFSWEDRKLLTVHHIDGDDSNNPPDGSNWENLCIYCHEDEHSRERLADYWRGDE
ncbi:MAG: YajD family HNH nuclease [bacterium]